MLKNRELLERKVIDWAEARNIFAQSNPQKQFSKTLEEIEELKEAIELDDYDAIVDAIGDVTVTLCILAKMFNTTLTNCLSVAYEKIKHRQGFMQNGVFVKFIPKTLEDKFVILEFLCKIFNVDKQLKPRIQQTTEKNKYGLLLSNALCNGIRPFEIATFFECKQGRITYLMRNLSDIHKYHVIPPLKILKETFEDLNAFYYAARRFQYTYKEIGEVLNMCVTSVRCKLAETLLLTPKTQQAVEDYIETTRFKPLTNLQVNEVKTMLNTLEQTYEIARS